MATKLDLENGNLGELASVFGLLARLWAREVDADILKLLADKPTRTLWKDLGGIVPANNAQSIEDLAVAYCQLLIGPSNHVSPVQSVWDQSRFAGNASASMHKYIQMLNGFQPCVEFNDHIGVQLQYAASLLSMAEQAKGKQSLVAGLFKAFSDDHLEWSEKFFDATSAHTESDFYKGLVSVSRKFLFGE